MYLASGHELKRPQRALHVGYVRLQIIQRIGDAGLELRRRLPRGAGRGDLVERGGGCHDCGGRCSGKKQ